MRVRIILEIIKMKTNHMIIKIVSRLAQIFALIVMTVNVSMALDSSNLPMGTLVSATVHSFVLATGTSPFVQGNNQQIGSTPLQCPAGSAPKVITSLNDAGDSSALCPLYTIHAVGPYTQEAASGGYDVFIGFSNAVTPDLCHDRGISLNWTIYCIKSNLS